jgi:hypothetical protein
MLSFPPSLSQLPPTCAPKVTPPAHTPLPKRFVADPEDVDITWLLAAVVPASGDAPLHVAQALVADADADDPEANKGKDDAAAAAATVVLVNTVNPEYCPKNHPLRPIVGEAGLVYTCDGCKAQRVRWLVGCLVGLVGWLAGWLVGLVVGWWVGAPPRAK